MKNNLVRKLVLGGLFIALVFLATYFTRIPTPLPGGYFTLGDAVIMLAAVFIGPFGGMIAGGIGSAFADMAASALIFAPITLVVKGIEGLAVGLIAAKYRKNYLETGRTSPFNFNLILALVIGALIMVAGYFSGEAFILSIFDRSFGLAAAATEIPSNLVQGGLSAILGYVLVLLLNRAGADVLKR
ncbi:MAG TPA: ECF transporter S component [Clostridia bacterium]|nr:ECF transporter S component [Clostridia bacterium]